MATVPGVLYIGDYHAAGGNPGLGKTDISADDGITPSLTLRDWRIDYITPSDAATLTPTASINGAWVWYDGAFSDTLYTVASSTTTTITVSPSPGWTTNEWVDRQITVRSTSPLAGVGFRQRLICLSNTGDTLTFATTTAPVVGATFLLGQGRFRDYHPSGGGLFPSELLTVGSLRGGGNWQNLGFGLGPDATMIPALYSRVWNTSPFFHFFKWLNLVDPVSTGWADSPNDSARADFLLEMARVEAAATARGHVTDWRVAIIDISTLDCAAIGATPALAATYKARLQQMIAWLRSAAVTDNPSLKIVLVTHRSDTYGVTYPGVYPTLASEHASIARSGTGIGVINLNGTITNVHPDLEVVYYTVGEYLRLGERLADMVVRMELGTPPEVEGGLPVYMLIGDSHAAGVVFQQWTAQSYSRRISGPLAPISLVRPSNQMIWNRATSSTEPYEPHVNSSTAGGYLGLAGPDLSIMAALGELHPDGFLLVKRAAAGATLALERTAFTGAADNGGNGGRWARSVTGENFDAAKADWDAATQYVNEVLGRQADLRGIFVSLGHNDAVVAGGGVAFAAALKDFVYDLWEVFATRTSGKKVPVVWRRPHPDSPEVDQTQIAAVRTALANLAKTESQFRVVDVDDLELSLDNVHETPESTVIHGERAVVELKRVAI